MLRFIFILLLFTGIFSCNHLLGNTFQNFNCDTISKPDIGPDTSICEGIILLLKNQFETPNATYLWSDGKTTSTIDVTKAGAYWLETTFLQCKKRDTINIYVLPSPRIASSKVYSFCEGKSVIVALQGDFNTVTWDDFPSQQNILVSSAKTYKYTAIKGLCELRSEINVREIKIPNPAIGDYIDKCRGEVQNLSVPSFSGAIKWSNGSQTKGIQVISSGYYSVTLTDSGCSKSDTVFVGFFDCKGEFLYFPNIIYPKSVNGNENFFPIVDQKYTVTQYKLSVFNTFGN
ncbi:MAG: hypothetical protein WAT46_17205, partial [Saprospiraceae bacterium]